MMDTIKNQILNKISERVEKTDNSFELEVLVRTFLNLTDKNESNDYMKEITNMAMMRLKAISPEEVKNENTL